MSKIHKLTIENCDIIANKNNGFCLDIAYINNNTKLMWRCKSNHIFLMKYNHVQFGHWCPECAGLKKKDISFCYKIAKDNDGYFLSKDYINSREKYLWGCNKGHEWFSSYGDVKQGYWCLECSGKKQKTIEDCVIMAKNYDGICLEKCYTNNRTKIRWQCKNGHIFEMTYSDVLGGHWCKYCKVKNERELKEILENIFKVVFVSIRPNWLKNKKTGKNLEIDLYNEKLKLAIEYNGEQHFMPVNFGNISEEKAIEQLRQTKKRDELKKRLIKKAKEHVKHFIIFTYKEDINKENVILKLKKRGLF